jgi:hypothetical protein
MNSRVQVRERAASIRRCALPVVIAASFRKMLITLHPEKHGIFKLGIS